VVYPESCCRRYPRAVAMSAIFADEHWCGEFKTAWMPVGDPEGRGAMTVQPYIHMRTHQSVRKNTKGECFTEEEYNDRNK